MKVLNNTDYENQLPSAPPVFLLLDLAAVVLLLIATIWFCVIWDSMKKHQLQLTEKYQLVEQPPQQQALPQQQQEDPLGMP